MGSKVRTAEELADIRYNYFKAFSLDPDKTDFEDKQTVANLNKNLYTKANKTDPIEMRIGTDLKKDVIEILVNDAVYDERTGTYMPNRGARAKEAAAYKKLKMQPVIEFCKELCKRGVIYKSEIQDVAKRHKLSINEIESSLKDVLKTIKYVDDLQNRFDFGRYSEVEKKLPGLNDENIKNLYDLLELPITSDLLTINNRLKEYMDRDATKAHLKSGTSLKALYGEAVSIFKEEGDRENVPGRRQYVKYIKIRDDVYLPLKAISDNGLTIVREADYLKYIDLIMKKSSCSLKEAEEDLGAIFAALRLKLSGDASVGDKVEIEICPYAECGKPYIASAGITVCPNCGKPLTVLCWNCHTPVRFSTKTVVCPKCSMTDKMQQVFNAKVNELDVLFKEPKTTLSAFKSALNVLKSTVPGYEKMPSSEVAKKISFYDNEISAKDKEEESMLRQYREMMVEVEKFIALKQLYKAEAKIKEIESRLPGYNVDGNEKYKKVISAGLQRANQYLQSAKRTSDTAQIVSFTAKALEECSDNVEAQQILKKYPPKAPDRVNCTITDDGKVNIEWSAAGDSSVSYTVVRKTGTAPKNISDGTPVAKDLILTFFEDANIGAGTKYYYGVYATRFGVNTALTVCQLPAIVLSDIVNYRQEMCEGKICIKWSCPSNVKRIDVRKKCGAQAADDGSLYSGANSDGFTDDKCNGEGNTYFVRCVYEVDGKEVFSRGTQMYFKPFYFPKTIGPIKVKQQTDGLCAISAENIQSDTQLYLSKEKLAVPVKKAEKSELLSNAIKTAKKFPLFDSGDGSYTFALPVNLTGYLYAVNLNEQLFNISEPIFITSLNGLKITNYTEQSGVLTVNLELASEVSEVIVKTSNQRFAENLDDNGDIFTFSADKIRNDKQFTLRLKSDCITYVTLFAKVNGVGGVFAICAPVQLPDAIDYRKKQIVRYALFYETSAQKPFNLTIKFEADSEVSLPDYVIVKGNPRPLNKNAGELVERVSGFDLKKGMFTHGKYTGKVTLKMSPMPKSTKIAMFFADNNVKNVQMKEVKNL